MSRPIPIRLGTLDSASEATRDFGRAADVRNIDILKTNEVSRRKGYVRRLATQMSGPIRFWHQYGGLCGRFYDYAEGGGVISISGNPGAGPLRETLDLDGTYDPDGDSTDPGGGDTNVGTGTGNPGNTITPGGAGTITTDDGVIVQQPGIQRHRPDVDQSDTESVVDDNADNPQEDDSSSDPADPNYPSFSFDATLDSLNTTTVTWAFRNPLSSDVTGYVEVYRAYGTSDPVSQGVLVRRDSNLNSSITDTVDEYQDAINYKAIFVLDGLGTFGPYSSNEIEAKEKSFTLTLPTYTVSGASGTMTLQSIHWTGANDTTYEPETTVLLTISGDFGIGNPVVTQGWTAGAKNHVFLPTAITTGVATITATDSTTGYSGSSTMTIVASAGILDTFDRVSFVDTGYPWVDGYVNDLDNFIISSNRLTTSDAALGSATWNAPISGSYACYAQITVGTIDANNGAIYLTFSEDASTFQNYIRVYFVPALAGTGTLRVIVVTGGSGSTVATFLNVPHSLTSFAMKAQWNADNTMNITVDGTQYDASIGIPSLYSSIYGGLAFDKGTVGSDFYADSFILEYA